MSNISFKNRVTGKTHIGKAEDVETLKSNPVTSRLFTFESEVEKPADIQKPKTAKQKAEEEKAESATSEAESTNKD